MDPQKLTIDGKRHVVLTIILQSRVSAAVSCLKFKSWKAAEKLKKDRINILTNIINPLLDSSIEITNTILFENMVLHGFVDNIG